VRVKINVVAGPKSAEKEAQAAILDYLVTRGHFAIRLNNQPIYDPSRKIFRTLPKHTPKGLPDILVVRNPITFIEVKGLTGRLSYDQIEFKERCTQSGAQPHHCQEHRRRAGSRTVKNRPLVNNYLPLKN
jgi:hypothetical protein